MKHHILAGVLAAAALTAPALAEDAAAIPAGTAAAGETVFRQCMACHTVAEGQNRVGPSLYGIVGREAGSVAGFRYSDANKNSGVTWDEATLFEYLKAPRTFIEGTTMAFAGIPDAQKRADLIAYLKEQGPAE